MCGFGDTMLIRRIQAQYGCRIVMITVAQATSTSTVTGDKNSGGLWQSGPPEAAHQSKMMLLTIETQLHKTASNAPATPVKKITSTMCINTVMKDILFCHTPRNR